MPRPRHHDLDDEILSLLASSSQGLASRELGHALRSRPSQPTLSRRLMDLRARGKIAVSGKGPSTRYHVAAGNELPKLRSRLLHQAIARKLVREPTLMQRALTRLQKLESANPSARRYHERWRALIAGPTSELLRILTEDSEAAADLRQESPFSTLLEPAERDRVFRRLRVA